MKNNIIKIKGFTLIEIMVSMSIFMIIMLIALGALITFSDTAKKAQALRSAMDNVNFAMENMTRSLRMGNNYTCISVSSFSVPTYASSTPADCPLLGTGGGGSAVEFTQAIPADPLLRDTAYARVLRPDGITSSLQKCTLNDCVDLVSSDIDIQDLRFFVDGSAPIPVDYKQPSVYILIKGIVTVKGEQTAFAIQTLASQRSVE